MTIKQSQNPYGYRNLLVYKKAEELQAACSELTHLFPKTKTLIALADQMDRSARSTKQNITEGWKRNTTNEYYQFLGFAIASNAELEEDFTDIWKGFYPELMGIRGIMGEKGVAPSSHLAPLPPSSHLVPSSPPAPSTPSSLSSPLTPSPHFPSSSHLAPSSPPAPSTPSSLSSPLTPSPHFPSSSHLAPSSHFDIEKLPFYPLGPHLPPVVQLKLRAKELNFLLDRLQKSLLDKMARDHVLSAADKLKRSEDEKRNAEEWYENMLAEHNLIRLENGRVVKKSDL